MPRLLSHTHQPVTMKQLVPTTHLVCGSMPDTFKIAEGPSASMLTRLGLAGRELEQ